MLNDWGFANFGCSNTNDFVGNRERKSHEAIEREANVKF
jgi:hypothetical protein